MHILCLYNGVQYFYITNQLGDILTITDSSGDAFVMYSYDEWGKPIETLTCYGLYSFNFFNYR